VTEATKTFVDLGVNPAISAALAEAGITTPFPIQELTLPLALSRADVIGQARTGTGKTLAFGIPLLQAIDPERRDTQALVIVPTRELCLQVHDDLAKAGSRRGISTAAIYGGKAIEVQTSTLQAGAHVVVGTPGRLLDLRRRGTLDLSKVSTLVLDEADEMLDMGFLPDVEQLIEACASERQTLLFSATMPSEVVGLARRYMTKPTFMRADVEEPQIGPDTRQVFLACHRLDKPAVLARILRTPNRGLCVVFTRTKRMADVLVTELADHGVSASAIHSNLRQDARERTLDRFRRGKVDVLCATEVAARGLDISDVTHVVNYDCPDDERMYLHRIGRTGRAGAGGVAVTLAVWNEQARLDMIKKGLGIDAPTHEVFSTSPELDELFGPEAEPAGTAAPAQPEPGPQPEPATPERDTTAGKDRRRADREAPAADGEQARPTRRRSRTRTRKPTKPTKPTKPANDATNEAPPAPEEPKARESVRSERTEPDGAAAEDGGDSRSATHERRRVRSRTTRHRAAQPADKTTEPNKPASPAERPAPRASGAETRPARSRAGGTTAKDAEGERERSTRHRSGRSRQRPEGDRNGGGSSPDDQRERTPSNDSGKSGKERSEAGTRQAVSARGEGQPALSRPMTISHLP
jgi:superfamily II DNA/RNA helicase